MNKTIGIIKLAGTNGGYSLYISVEGPTLSPFSMFARKRVVHRGNFDFGGVIAQKFRNAIKASDGW